ncbi:MAG: hypothetical protein V3V05_02440 [Pontiella sp.]
MRTAKLLLFVFFCSFYGGIVQAATLKDKPATILYPAGHYLEGWPRTVGNDMYGYNYQAHTFKGSFANVYLGGDGYPPYGGDTEAYYQGLVEYGFAANVGEAEALVSATGYWADRDIAMHMKWNDQWLSNQDRGDDALDPVPDGNLDRHYGYPSYTGSGAWLTNHRSGIDYLEHNGRIKQVRWSQFVKFVVPPSTAVNVDGIWYTADGVEIGPERFGSFAVVQYISNDPVYGEHGVFYRSPNGSGFGMYGPE